VPDRAFIIQQIGAKDSAERRRADEIYNFIIVPAVEGVGLEPYRADLDLSPGAITPRMLSELLRARVVIADLTGRNPNVFYELGITHSFARPLISIADSSRSLPFDAKDERVIELGEYPESGLGWAQGQTAKASLEESLRIVLTEGYSPPSPLREVAANNSIDQLAPENPLAAEMAQIRETLEQVRKYITSGAMTPSGLNVALLEHDSRILRVIIERKATYLTDDDLLTLSDNSHSPEQLQWALDLYGKWSHRRSSSAAGEPPS
jgi:hypothetical protein